MMRIAPLLLMMLSACLRAEQGISVEVVPTQVQPGDLFEMRVVMDRADYGRFELEVPGNTHLHRAAVETVPVRLDDGRYRQSETWLLQADSSGEFVIDGAVAKVESGNGIETVTLPSMRVEVLPYAAKDESSDPVDYPEDEEVAERQELLAWIVGGVLFALLLWWWVSRSNTTGVIGQERVDSDAAKLIERLKEGTLDRRALEHLMVEQKWSDESSAALAEVVYGGGKDVEGLMILLRKEVAK